MQILLTSNVDKVGRKGEMVVVSEGYGRNFLLKRRLGVIPTPQDIARYKAAQIKKESSAQARNELLHKLKVELESFELRLELKANNEGHLFGAVKESDIVEQLNQKFENILDKSMIQISSPIKAIGQYEIDINLANNIKTKIKLYVQAKN